MKGENDMATKKKKNTKTTRDRAANIASHLLKTSNNREVLTVAASALSQSDPNPDHPRRRRNARTSAEEDAGFKAGKDL
jgi:hypothetical protein